MRTILPILLVFLSLSLPVYSEELPLPAITRDANVLLDQYYFLKNKDPFLAKTTLTILLQQYPNNIRGLLEMGYWHLNYKQGKEALPFFIKAYSLNKDPQVALQIAYLLNGMNKNDEAIIYFQYAQKASDPTIKQKATMAINTLTAAPPATIAGLAAIPSLSPTLPEPSYNQKMTSTAELFTLYYYMKKINLLQAEKILVVILKQDPNNIMALTEMGYIKLAQDDKQGALSSFMSAFSKNKADFSIALQIAYILNTLGRTQEAIPYYNYAAQSPNADIKQNAIKALTVLAPKNVISTNENQQAYASIPSIAPSREPKTPVAVDESTALFEEYYRLKKTQPLQATILLEKILRLEPNNTTALAEMGYLKIRQKKSAAAVTYFKKLYSITRDSKYALQVGYLLAEMGDRKNAQSYFKVAYTSGNKEIKKQSEQALFNLNQTPTANKVRLQIISESSDLEIFYKLKKSNPTEAKKILLSYLAKNPNNIIALKEAGFLALSEDNHALANQYLTRAYKLQPSDQLALQIGYILAVLKKSQEAREYFALAARSNDAKIKNEAVKALNVLSGAGTPTAEPKDTETTTTLLNQYYSIKKNNPVAAKEILLKILTIEPANITANKELAYTELGQGNFEQAVSYFKKVYETKPEDEIALQLGYILANLNKMQEAQLYFAKASNSTDRTIRKKSLAALAVLKKQSEVTLPTPTLNSSEIVLNHFYKLKKIDKLQAKTFLIKALNLDPTNIKLLKELGYLSLELKDNCTAYLVFKKVYDLTCDFEIASQLGYVTDALGRKREAYYYFCAASKSPDAKLSLKANISMTNLAGWQTRVIPDPFFMDLYMSPLYYSRFDLGILPIITRAGIYVGKNNRAEIYGSIRGTRDTRSSGSDISPQIFEDNVAVFALGARVRIFDKVPLYFYAEGGRAYDLIYRNRDRWRGDLRGGLIYFDRYGKQGTYVDNLKFPFKFAGDIYGDSTYYTRYQNNWITNVRVRPGIRILEYRASYIDTYVKGLYIVDTNHEFFNNLVEYGPGIVLVPYNRINFDFRFETVRGSYIKVNSPSPNPYGSHYNNKIFLCELYVRF